MKPAEYRPVTKEELVFDVNMGLRKARKLLPRRAEPLGVDPFRLAAQEVVEHLALAGVRCYRGPPGRLHSTGAHPAEPSSESGSAGE